MPYFMDVHHLEGATLADIEQAHLRDVEAQERHGVNYVRFFHDPDGGNVFCVAEAPSAQACVAVHVEANGMRPDRIIPVEPILLDGLLGGGDTRPSGVAVDTSGAPDDGLRTIMFTDIVDSTRLTEALGDVESIALVDAHNEAVRDQLVEHGGREVKHTGDGLMASFHSPADAVACGVAIQEALQRYRAAPDALPLHVRIGLNCGVPVAAHGDLFGIAVNLARRICDAAGNGEVWVSADVAERLGTAGPRLQHLGPRSFKGLREPVVVHRVVAAT